MICISPSRVRARNSDNRENLRILRSCLDQPRQSVRS